MDRRSFEAGVATVLGLIRRGADGVELGLWHHRLISWVDHPESHTPPSCDVANRRRGPRKAFPDVSTVRDSLPPAPDQLEPWERLARLNQQLEQSESRLAELVDSLTDHDCGCMFCDDMHQARESLSQARSFLALAVDAERNPTGK